MHKLILKLCTGCLALCMLSVSMAHNADLLSIVAVNPFPKTASIHTTLKATYRVTSNVGNVMLTDIVPTYPASSIAIDNTGVEKACHIGEVLHQGDDCYIGLKYDTPDHATHISNVYGPEVDANGQYWHPSEPIDIQVSESSADIRIQKTQDFEHKTVYIGGTPSTTQATYAVINEGSADAVVYDRTASAGHPIHFVGEGCKSGTLLEAKGGHCTFIVEYAPTQAGTIQDGDAPSISIDDGAVTQKSQDTYDGLKAVEHQLTIAATRKFDPTVSVGHGTTAQYTIQNDSDDAITLATLNYLQDKGIQLESNSTCKTDGTTILQPKGQGGDRCTLELRYAPEKIPTPNPVKGEAPKASDAHGKSWVPAEADQINIEVHGPAGQLEVDQAASFKKVAAFTGHTVVGHLQLVNHANVSVNDIQPDFSPTDFVLKANQCATLAPGDKCLITYTYKPTVNTGNSTKKEMIHVSSSLNAVQHQVIARHIALGEFIPWPMDANGNNKPLSNSIHQAIASSDHRYIFLSTVHGLSVSQDFGTTWTTITTEEGLPYNNITHLAVSFDESNKPVNILVIADHKYVCKVARDLSRVETINLPFNYDSLTGLYAPYNQQGNLLHLYVSTAKTVYQLMPDTYTKAPDWQPPKGYTVNCVTGVNVMGHEIFVYMGTDSGCYALNWEHGTASRVLQINAHIHTLFGTLSGPDDSGNLYYGTLDGVLIRIHKLVSSIAEKTPRVYMSGSPPSNVITGIYASKMHVYIGTAHEGLYMVNPADGSAQKVKNFPAEYISDVHGFVDDVGKVSLYVATRDRGLMYSSDGGQHWAAVSGEFPGNEITHMDVSAEHIYASTLDDLDGLPFHFGNGLTIGSTQHAAGSWINTDEHLRNMLISAVCSTQDGVYVGTPRELVKYHADGTIDADFQAADLPSEHVMGIFAAKDGAGHAMALYVVTTKGCVKLDAKTGVQDKNFATVSADILSMSMVYNAQHEPQTAYVAIRDGKTSVLQKLDPQTGKLTALPQFQAISYSNRDAVHVHAESKVVYISTDEKLEKVTGDDGKVLASYVSQQDIHTFLFHANGIYVAEGAQLKELDVDTLQTKAKPSFGTSSVPNSQITNISAEQNSQGDIQALLLGCKNGIIYLTYLV